MIVIPAFAVDRTQTIMYIIRKLEDANRTALVYVDSPMAISVTDLYMRHHEDHVLNFTQQEAAGNPLDAHNVHYMRSVEDSKKINNVKTPAIIISASGMATGGRSHTARAPRSAQRHFAGWCRGGPVAWRGREVASHSWR